MGEIKWSRSCLTADIRRNYYIDYKKEQKTIRPYKICGLGTQKHSSIVEKNKRV